MWHVCRRNPFRLFFLAKTFNSWRHQKVSKVGFLSANPARTSAGSVLEFVNQWSVMDSNYFSPYIFWPKICPRSFQATHACHSEVSNRSFGLWSPRPFVSIFRCRPHVSMFAKCDSVPKEICSTCLSEESMPFVKSKPPLPSRSLRSLRAAARSTSSLWLRNACKKLSQDRVVVSKMWTTGDWSWSRLYCIATPAS